MEWAVGNSVRPMRTSAWTCGSNSFDFFFLAMAHWQLGKKGEARQWHDKAVEWMEENKPDDEELRCLRTEAEELLGIVAPQ